MPYNAKNVTFWPSGRGRGGFITYVTALDDWNTVKAEEYFKDGENQTQIVDFIRQEQADDAPDSHQHADRGIECRLTAKDRCGFTKIYVEDAGIRIAVLQANATPS